MRFFFPQRTFFPLWILYRWMMLKMKGFSSRCIAEGPSTRACFSREFLGRKPGSSRQRSANEDIHLVTAPVASSLTLLSLPFSLPLFVSIVAVARRLQAGRTHSLPLLWVFHIKRRITAWIKFVQWRKPFEKSGSNLHFTKRKDRKISTKVHHVTRKLKLARFNQNVDQSINW